MQRNDDFTHLLYEEALLDAESQEDVNVNFNVISLIIEAS